MLRSVPSRAGRAPKTKRAAIPPLKRADNIKSAVLNAARKLCFANGPDGVTARKIAAEVGCSATAIYLYYDSVDHVLHQLRLEGHGVLADYLRRPLATSLGLDRLLAMQREYHRFGKEHPNYFSLMFLARFPEGPLKEVFRQESDSLLIVRDAVTRAIESGAVRADLDPLIVTNGVWLLIHGLTALAVSGHLSITAPGREQDLVQGVLDSTAAWLRP